MMTFVGNPHGKAVGEPGARGRLRAGRQARLDSPQEYADFVSPANHVLAIASGKGGVGKSTVALNLSLALRAGGARVGLLDADFYGPDIPLMVNLKREASLRRWDLWRGGEVRLEPVERYGLQLMSVGFLLGERQALPFAAQSLVMGLRQFLGGTDWGELDYLVIDLPPGTADLQQEMTRTLELSGALIAVGPQDVAHLDAKRVVELFQSAGVRIIGGVENMSGLVCPHCGERVEVFPPVSAERSLWQLGVRRLATLPLDPATSQNGRGPVMVAAPESAQAQRFRDLASAVRGEID
jgi:ATP-binding protein involved in chromosome partitioning